METKYYKCVAVSTWNGRTLHSFIVHGKVGYTYRPGVWTPWRRYGAFIFKSLDAVSYFLTHNNPWTGYHEVWECEARDVREIRRIVYVDLLYQFGRNKIISLLNQANEHLDRYIYNTKEAPFDSYMASQIKLVRKLESNEY